MNPRRIAFRLVIWGIILTALGVIALTHDRFYTNVHGVRQLITRQNNPGIYWGVCLTPLLVGTVLCAVSFYLMRKPVDHTKLAPTKGFPWYLVIWGICLVGLAALGLGHHYLINRHSTEVNSSLITLLIGALLCTVGVYLMRKE